MKVFVKLTDKATNEEKTFNSFAAANKFLGKPDGYVQSVATAKNIPVKDKDGKEYVLNVFTYVI